MQLPFEIVGMDHPAGDLSGEAYRSVNPFEQIPAIDDDGVVLTESGAILIHLARKSGKLMPRDTAQAAQVVRWCFAALNSIEPPVLSIMILDWSQDPGCARHREFMVGWAQHRFGQLDGWLEGREFIATDRFTIADILMAHVLEAVRDESLIAPYPRTKAYRDRCFERAAWKRTLERYNERVVAA
jgi:glutathione S-transferase